MILQLGGMGKGLTHHKKKTVCYEMLHRPWNWIEGAVAGSYEHGTEPSGSIKVGNFLTS
jgi:hypothetical protein